MKQGTFELLDHTGDVALRIRAAGRREFFRTAVRALLSVYVEEGGTGSVGTGRKLPVDLEAEDDEALLVDLLNEAIYLFDVHQFLAADLTVSELSLESPVRLRGEFLGEILDPTRHRIATEIKAATYHALEICRGDGVLTADIVLDL